MDWKSHYGPVEKLKFYKHGCFKQIHFSSMYIAFFSILTFVIFNRLSCEELHDKRFWSWETFIQGSRIWWYSAVNRVGCCLGTFALIQFLPTECGWKLWLLWNIARGFILYYMDYMDQGTWWATVHGVAKTWTWLSDFTFTFIWQKELCRCNQGHS